MGTITENKVYKELNKDYRYLNNYIVAMEKSLFEQMGGTYTQVGDYFYNFIYIWP